MQNNIKLIALTFIAYGSCACARIPQALIHTGFATINTLLWDTAYRNSKYQSLFTLPDDQQKQLYDTYEHAITNATYRNAQPMVQWIPKTILRRHLPEDNGTYTRNIQQYISQCALHTILPENKAYTGLTMLPLAMMARRTLPAMRAIQYGFQVASTTLHACIALSEKETLRTWARPAHDYIYNTTRNTIIHNPALFDTLVQAYCYDHQNNPHIRNWMRIANHQTSYVPIHFNGQTYHITSSFISQTMKAAAGNAPLPQRLDAVISRETTGNKNTPR